MGSYLLRPVVTNLFSLLNFLRGGGVSGEMPHICNLTNLNQTY